MMRGLLGGASVVAPSASARWRVKCSKMSSAVFLPTKGVSSATEAVETRWIEPRFLSRRFFLFSPTPGMAVSSEVKSRSSRRLRW